MEIVRYEEGNQKGSIDSGKMSLDGGKVAEKVNMIRKNCIMWLGRIGRGKKYICCLREYRRDGDGR